MFTYKVLDADVAPGLDEGLDHLEVTGGGGEVELSTGDVMDINALEPMDNSSVDLGGLCSLHFGL